MEREPADTVREQASTSLEEGPGCIRIALSREATELVEDFVGDGVRRGADRAEQGDRVVGAQAGTLCIDGELEERGTRDAELVRPTPLDEAGCFERAESAGNQRGEKHPELVERGGRPRLVDVDELVRLEPQHLAEVGAGRPVAEEVTDAGERVAAIAEPPDELEAPEVARPVQPDAPLAPRGGDDSEGLVLADRADRQSRKAGELVDRPLGQRVVTGHAHHRLIHG